MDALLFVVVFFNEEFNKLYKKSSVYSSPPCLRFTQMAC